jgi:hypothetical protein
VTGHLRRERPAEDRGQHEQEDDDEACDRRLVLAEALPEQPARSLALDLDELDRCWRDSHERDNSSREPTASSELKAPGDDAAGPVPSIKGLDGAKAAWLSGRYPRRGRCRTQRDSFSLHGSLPPLRGGGRQACGQRPSGRGDPVRAAATGARAGADGARGRGPAADLGRPRQPRDRPAALPVGGDGQVARPSSAREASGPLPRTRGEHRLPPRHHRLTPRTATAAGQKRNWLGARDLRLLAGTSVSKCFPLPVQIPQEGEAPGLWKTQARHSRMWSYQPTVPPATAARVTTERSLRMIQLLSSRTDGNSSL